MVESRVSSNGLQQLISYYSHSENENQDNLPIQTRTCCSIAADFLEQNQIKPSFQQNIWSIKFNWWRQRAIIWLEAHQIPAFLNAFQQQPRSNRAKQYRLPRESEQLAQPQRPHFTSSSSIPSPESNQGGKYRRESRLQEAGPIHGEGITLQAKCRPRPWILQNPGISGW